MKQYITILFFLGFLPTFLEAQIVPPDFLCVKGDTLFWNLPANNCGPFVGYEIYTSDNANGPFTLLATVNNQGQTFFHDPNPSGELRFYYLQSDFDCPGFTAFQSDTLDSRPPEVSPLNAVTVVGGDVLLNWQESPSPEVAGYIIYRRDPIGVVPIDTVMAGTSIYIDSNAEPDMESESYFVNALDRCGNTSIFDLEHNTIYLEGTVTSCDISLNWNAYNNWPNGVGSQELLLSINGGVPFVYETLPGLATSFLFTDVNDGDDYCFILQANESGTSNVSHSNEYCVSSSFVQPINELYVTNVSVIGNDEITVDWNMNTGASVELVEIFRENNSGSFDLIATQTPNNSLPSSNQFLDQNAGSSLSSQTYQILVTDSCGNQLESTFGTTIFLTGNRLNATANGLNWTPLSIENVTVQTYQIVRIVGGIENSLGTVNSNVFSFEDEFDLSAIGDGTICYYVQATGSGLSPSGSPFNVTSRSNVVCIDQPITIHAPNAFAPNGFNQEFKPLILSGNIARYEMQVFDRYGSMVFSADSPDEGWGGKKDGKKLPQGVYVYRIAVVLENGDHAEKKGNVLLLR